MVENHLSRACLPTPVPVQRSPSWGSLLEVHCGLIPGDIGYTCLMWLRLARGVNP